MPRVFVLARGTSSCRTLSRMRCEVFDIIAAEDVDVTMTPSASRSSQGVPFFGRSIAPSDSLGLIVTHLLRAVTNYCWGFNCPAVPDQYVGHHAVCAIMPST